MNMQQEQWINEVMNSLKGIQKAEGNTFLHTRVLASLQNKLPAKKEALLSIYALSMTVAAVLVLNAILWSQPITTTPETDTTSVTMANDYDLTSIDY
jgi:uncharacterized protein (DUF2267 family)